jgi:ABC-type branched-subunit amino acid transport system ATPase component
MLRLANLHSSYGDSHIIQGVDLFVPANGRVALVGRNGVGKSTLLKSIMNAGPRVDGLVEWNNRPLAKMPTYKRSWLGIAFVPEDRRILPNLTVLENLEIAHRGTPTEREPLPSKAILLKFPMLIPLENRLGGRLSGGQQQMLAIARAMVARPTLLLLDEPTEGLAPAIVEQLAQSVVEACEQADTALLLCEQNLWFARKCTTYVYVMDSGRVVFEGDWNTFDSEDAVKSRHLAV